MAINLLEWVQRVIDLHDVSKSQKSALVKRIAERWALEIDRDVVRPVRARLGDRAETVLQRALSGMISAALFADGLAIAKSEGSRRCVEIDDAVLQNLTALRDLLEERGRLLWDGAIADEPPSVCELFEDLARIEPSWMMVTGVRESLAKIVNTSQAAPTMLHFIEAAIHRWPVDYTPWHPSRGDRRSRFEHEALDILQPIKELTHRERATLLNVARNSDQHTEDTVKQLLARRRRRDG